LQANPNELQPYVRLIALTATVGFFCFISFLSSILSGWHKLSERFCAQSEPYGATKSAGPFFYTIYMRFWGRYSSMVHMTAAEDGLYLSVIFLLRIGHPPLCIPWREIQFSRTKHFWRSYVVLTLGERERIPMRIPEQMAGKLGIMDRLPG
jgi:hypothetical protein